MDRIKNSAITDTLLDRL